MTAHDIRVTRAAKVIKDPPRRPHHPLWRIDTKSLARRVVVFTPNGAEVEKLMDNARRDIAGLTTNDVIFRVMSFNPDCFWAFARRERYDAMAPEGEGFLALLMLNDEGVRRLLDGSLNTRDPDPAMLTPQNVKPAGIYLWCVHARGPLAGGIPLVFEKVSTPLYRGADMYARAVTADGHRILESCGFQRGASYRGLAAPHLHMYRRSDPLAEDMPRYDRYGRGEGREVAVTVARSIEDLMRAMTLRGAVSMADPQRGYDEFDGNDFSATHLLGYVGDEPAGCVRIRYFADFAQIERLTVRAEFRRAGVGSELIRAAIEFCQAKGYCRVHAQAPEPILGFWSRFGFEPMDESRLAPDEVEIALDIGRHPQAITIGIDPHVIIRPEGRWHLPGLSERTAIRPVAPPPAQRRRA
jgi:predicted GNAT family N-acyltransferase